MPNKKFVYNSLDAVGEDVYIASTVVWKRPHLAYLGNHIAIDDFCYFTTAINLGDYIHIAPYVSIIGGEDGMFVAGDFCTIAAGCRIVVRGDEHLGKGLVSPVIPPAYRDEVVGQNIVMNRFSALGTNVIMFPNTWLAEGVVVGAGSVVTKPINDPWTIWIGSPAKKVKNRPKEIMLDYAERLGYKHE